MKAVSLHTTCMAFAGFFVNLIKSILNWLDNFIVMTWVYSVIAMLRGTRTVDKKLPALDNCEQVSERCYRVLGLNPGPHTLHGTNTYLIGTGTTRALIDTGESRTAVEWVNMLLNEAFPTTGTQDISHVILTHGHYDHLGGVPFLIQELKKRDLPIPRVYKRRICQEKEGKSEEEGQGLETGHYPASFPCLHMKDGEEFKLHGSDGQNTTLRCIYTPGHTDDSVCLVVLEDFAVLSGDSVLGCGTSVFDDLHLYMKSLSKIRELFFCQQSNTPCTTSVATGTASDTATRTSNSTATVTVALHSIYPGHGPIVRQRSLEHIDAYITNRKQREHHLSTILSCQSDRTFSSLELVTLVYGLLPWGVYFSAHKNLVHHLHKLQTEGCVQQTFGASVDIWEWTRAREKTE